MSNYRELILKTLEEEFDGDVYDPNGFATRIVFDKMMEMKVLPAKTKQPIISTLMKPLEDEGLIVRDMPNPKRTTRIVLASKASRQGHKSISTLLTHFASNLTDQIEDLVTAAIEAEVQQRLQNVDAPDVSSKIEKLEERNALLVKQCKLLQQQVSKQSRLGRIQELRDECEALKERAELAERRLKAEIRRNNDARYIISQSKISEHLDDATYSKLQKLMKEVPAGI